MYTQMFLHGISEDYLDVSFPYGYQRKLCIFTAIDDASRFVFSKIYSNHTEVSTLHFIKHVIATVLRGRWRGGALPGSPGSDAVR